MSSKQNVETDKKPENIKESMYKELSTAFDIELKKSDKISGLAAAKLVTLVTQDVPTSEQILNALQFTDEKIIENIEAPSSNIESNPEPETSSDFDINLDGIFDDIDMDDIGGNNG